MTEVIRIDGDRTATKSLEDIASNPNELRVDPVRGNGEEADELDLRVSSRCRHPRPKCFDFGAALLSRVSTPFESVRE